MSLNIKWEVRVRGEVRGALEMRGIATESLKKPGCGHEKNGGGIQDRYAGSCVCRIRGIEQITEALKGSIRASFHRISI